MSKPFVLLIDDNEETSPVVRAALERDSYTVLESIDPLEILKIVKSRKPDVILLELLLPDYNGLGLIAKIRKLTDAPIIIISSKASLIDKVIGFEAGADDYLAKPFHTQELVARVMSHARRYRRSLNARPEAVQDKRVVKIRFDDWVLDRARMQLNSVQGEPARLTVKEFRLLEVFAMSPNQVFSREQLLDASRGFGFNVTERAIDTQVGRLRKKIDAPGHSVIQSISGVGYIFASETENLSE